MLSQFTRAPHELAEKRPPPSRELRRNEWPLCGGPVGGKFGGIDLRSRLVLLLSDVEFEDTADVNIGEPMLDGCGCFLVGSPCVSR